MALRKAFSRLSLSVGKTSPGDCKCAVGVTDADILQSLEPYIYTPLSTSHHSRVFELMPDQQNGPIRVLMKEIDNNNEDTSFMALSYAWGSSRKPHLISVDGFRMNITCSLHSALIRIRANNMNIPILFADAICINQARDPEALQERAAQVQIMNLIFGKASLVLVDIGDDVNGCTEAVDLLSEFSNIPNAKWDAVMKNDNLLNRLGMRHYRDDAWQALADFTAQRWFGRLWVVQEFALARTIVVMFHFRLFSEDVLWKGVYRSMTFLKLWKIAVSKNPSSIPWDWKYAARLLEQIHGPCHRMVNIVDMRARVQKNSRKPPFTLGELMFETREFDVTDPRDRLYAIYGIAVAENLAPMTPNYNLPVSFTSEQMTELLLQNGQINMLLYRLAGLNQSKSSSWMPDFSTRRVENAMDRQLDENGQHTFKVFSASRSTTATFQRTAGSPFLSVKGCLLDTIVYVSEPFIKRFPETAKTKTDWDTDGRNICLWDLETKKHVWSALATSTNHNTMMVDYHNAITAEGLLMAATERWEGVSIPKITTSEAYAIQRWEESLTKYTAKKVRSYSPPPELNNPPPIIMQYVAHMAGACTNRRICVTQKGKIGMVPLDAVKGDLVAIFIGGCMPMTLRRAKRKGQEHHRLIGSCYLHGVMHGEALDRPDWRVEDIVLG